jgi:hypothetical protein
MMAFAARLASNTDGLESGLDRMDSVSVRVDELVKDGA